MPLELLDRLNSLVGDAKDGPGGDGRGKFYKMLREKVIEELDKPTPIAVIGKTGVGKTSTINALFGTDWKVSHVRAATRHEQVYLYENDRGKLKISDLPGLGEDLETETNYRQLYTKVLKKCELVLLVLKADSRDMLEVQQILSEVVAGAMPDLHERIVVGLNQIDLVQPGQWIEEANIPSPEQEENIEKIIQARLSSIQKTCPMKSSQIVAYSAKRRYHLIHLFLAMMSQTAGEAWVLDAKKNIADWSSFVNPKYLPPTLRD